MVGAQEVGDFAWAFENLFNAFVDGKVAAGESLFEAARMSVGVLGDLRARMLGEPSGVDTAGIKALQGFARQLAEGGQPDLTGLQSLALDSPARNGRGGAG